MKKGIMTPLIILLAVLVWSTAWADFYVIAAGKRAKRTILVSPQSTQAASGTALLNALNGITDAAVGNRYLFIIEPGIYDLGTNSLNMKEYVDIEGSGEGVTIISGTVDSASSNSGVVNGADNSELRFLTVRNKRTSGTAIAVFNSSVEASMKMLHVTALTHEGSVGLRFPVYNYYSYTTMTHVTALSDSSGSNTAVYNVYGAPVIRDSEITAKGGTTCYGVYNYNSTVSIYNTIIKASNGSGDNCGIYNTGSVFGINVYGSQIYGEDNSIYHNSAAVSARWVLVSSTSQVARPGQAALVHSSAPTVLQ